MKPPRLPFATAPLALAAILLSQPDAAAQFGAGTAIGQFYRVEPPVTAAASFDAVRIERVAPHAMVMPSPIEPLRLGVPLRELTGQIIELPERQRFYFSAVDARGAVRLFEIDLLTREARQVIPRAGGAPPYAVHMLAAPEATKLYVQWFRPGSPYETDIYDGASLRWLGSTTEFRPDERAAGYQHQQPYLWTLDLADQPALVDTGRDRVVRRFDHQRVFGPVNGVAGDIWRDVVLVRLDAGHDRYQLVDMLSGEIGPPLDLEGYRRAQPRLVLDGRFLVLVDLERRPYRRRWAETAIATGGGAIYNLRSGRHIEDFSFIVPHDFPVTAVGTNDDPTMPGRAWVHVPGDHLRFDFELPACERRPPRGDALAAELDARWDPSGESPIYRYRVRVASSSAGRAGAIAVRAGRETDRTAAPDGWGVDLIDRDRWVRWTNGLGPADDDVAPGTSRGGFVIAARADTRPGIAEYRIQAAIGLPRGCESDDRFLENGIEGYTVAPERVETDDPRKLAQRLERLMERACEIGWVEGDDCPALRSAAEEIESASADRAAAVDRFLEALSITSLSVSASDVLADAASAVREALEPSP